MSYIKKIRRSIVEETLDISLKHWKIFKLIYQMISVFVSVHSARLLPPASRAASRRRASRNSCSTGISRFVTCFTGPPKFLRAWSRCSRCAWSTLSVKFWRKILTLSRISSLWSSLCCRFRHVKQKLCAWLKFSCWLKPCNLKCDALNKSWSLKSTQVFYCEVV